MMRTDEELEALSQTNDPWWAEHGNLAQLVRHLADQGYSGDDIAYVVEKPWKYENEFRALAEEALDEVEGPCKAIVYPTGKPEPCGQPKDTEWLHYNRDDSRAIDHEYQWRSSPDVNRTGDDPDLQWRRIPDVDEAPGWNGAGADVEAQRG